MREWFLQYSASFSGIFFLRQVLVILAIFLLGFLITLISSPDGKIIKCAILAFPTGLSLFVILGCMVLLTGIPYNTWVILALYIIAFAICFVFLNKKQTLKKIFEKGNLKILFMIFGAVVVLACIATSGLVPVSISNDSFYYFHEYPRDIVYFGGLRDQFDSFLTDVGFGAVTMETLPFLFGFNESFGIREFMHMDFTAFFVYGVYEKSETICDRKKCLLLSLLCGLILAFSSPVFVLGHWVMANMYFMEYFFMAAVLMYQAGRIERKDDTLSVLPAMIILVACSLMRMEGGIFILFLLSCLTVLRLRKGELLGMSLVILLLVGGYSLKIYMLYKIDNPYTFLTPEKAVLQAGAFMAMIIYIAFLRDFINRKIGKLLPFIILLGLILGNGVLLLYNSELYITNLKAFYGNLTRQSGWGMLPYLVLSSVIIITVCDIEAVLHKEGKLLVAGDFELSFYTLLTIGFLLVTLAVSFMRGDALMAEIGDSGNRVLLQITPLLLYTLMLYFIKIYERFKQNN